MHLSSLFLASFPLVHIEVCHSTNQTAARLTASHPLTVSSSTRQVATRFLRVTPGHDV